MTGAPHLSLLGTTGLLFEAPGDTTLETQRRIWALARETGRWPSVREAVPDVAHAAQHDVHAHQATHPASQGGGNQPVPEELVVEWLKEQFKRHCRFATPAWWPLPAACSCSCKLGRAGLSGIGPSSARSCGIPASCKWRW